MTQNEPMNPHRRLSDDRPACCNGEDTSECCPTAGDVEHQAFYNLPGNMHPGSRQACRACPPVRNVQVVRVQCPHRIGLAYREGSTLTLLPCDCNDPSEVLEVVGVLPADCTAAGGCVADDAAGCAATSCSAAHHLAELDDDPLAAFAAFDAAIDAVVEREARLRDLAAEWSAVDAWGAGTTLTGAEAARALLAALDQEAEDVPPGSDRLAAAEAEVEAARAAADKAERDLAGTWGPHGWGVSVRARMQRAHADLGRALERLREVREEASRD